MESLRQDVRYALRALRQRPLFTLIAVLSIAIGIGANTAIFSAVNALLLRSVPGVGSPERAVEIGRTNRGGGFDTFSYPELRDMQTEVPALDRVAGWRMAELSYSTPEQGQRVMGYLVSQPYFEALGTTPLRGRFFAPEEDRVGAVARMAVVSYGFWQRELGGDPGVIGKSIDLNRQRFTVVGVTRPEFAGHLTILPADVYLPLAAWELTRPGWTAWEERRASWLMAVGRLAPGATLADANASLAALNERKGEEFPELYRGENARGARAMALSPLLGGMRTPVKMFLSLMLGLVGVILLITCANVAGMLLARAASREREIALRLALGAGRGRLVRALLTESLLLFVIGGTAGVALGFWATSLLERIPIALPIPVQLELSADARVLAFGLGLAVLTGVVFGLAPALQGTRAAAMEVLRGAGGAGGRRSSVLRRAFVTAEVGLSVLLLVSAGLFLRSLQRAATIPTGFEPAGAHLMAFDLSIDGYDDERGKQFLHTLTARLAEVPGVRAAGAGSDLPLDLSVNEMPVFPVGGEGDESGLGTAFLNITPGYLEAVGTKLLRGRDFTDADRTGTTPVALVSRAFAAAAWPGQEPLGQQIAFEGEGTERATVVGVVEDVKNQTLMEETGPQLYLPAAQRYFASMYVVVRSELAPERTAQLLRETMRSIDPRLSLGPIQSLARHTGLGLLPQRMGALLASALGAIALLLSGMGVYGVIAFGVSQRTREIGVRMAIGARRRQVAGLIVRSALALTLPGLVVGAAAAFALAQLLRGFILGVAPTDVLTFSIAPTVLLGVVLLAAWVPAQRAAGIEPMSALRSE